MAVKKTGESKVKKVVGGIAVALALILVGGVCGGLLQHHYKWGEEPKVEEPGGEEKPGEDSSGGGEVSTEAGVSHGIRLAAVKLASSEYEAYGVSPLAESAYTLTATITPADAANKKVAAFGEQIIVKATSRDNAEAYATCTVEYLQRTTGYTLTLDGKTYNTAGTTTNSVTPDFSKTKSASATIEVNKSTVYTRANTDKATYIKIAPTTDLASSVGSMKVALGVPGILKTYAGASGSTITEFFDKAWGEAEYGTSAEGKNGFIDLISAFTQNAYEIKIYTENGGSELATFYIKLDASTILGQKGVESVTVYETEIVF